MVAQYRRGGADARLFSHREQGGRPRLALSRRALSTRDRPPALVSAWPVCMRTAMPAYAELAVTSNFSFLRGASDPEDLVKRAKALGLSGLGIADRNSVA